MVAELVVTMASSSGSAPVAIGHEGVVNVTINQGSVNQLMEGGGTGNRSSFDWSQ